MGGLIHLHVKLLNALLLFLHLRYLVLQRMRLSGKRI